LFDWAALRHSRRKPNLHQSYVIPTRRKQSRKFGTIILKEVITECRNPEHVGLQKHRNCAVYIVAFTPALLPLSPPLILFRTSQDTQKYTHFLKFSPWRSDYHWWHSVTLTFKERNLMFCIRNQFVPRCKHFPPRL
jgi:hypothetical protein